MDWSRTKTILILALILTNGILFYALYGDNIGSDGAEDIARSQIQEVLELLESEEVELDTEIPKQNIMLPDIRLTYESYEDGNILDILLGENYNEVDGRFLSKDAEVKIHGNQDLTYKMLNPMGGYVETDLDLATTLATQFIEDYGLNNSSVAIWNSRKQESGEVLVEFRQIENGYFVENAYMDIVVKGEEIVEFNRKWFGAIKIQDTSKRIESPAKALFRLLPAIDSNSTIERPVRIDSMDLGYRLVSNILTINFKEGEPSPYWRFRTDQGDVIYIEAQVE